RWHPQTGKLWLSLPTHYLFVEDVHALSDGRLRGLQQNGTRVQPWVIDPARECRTLLRHPLRVSPGEYRMTAIHKDGRLAAVGTSAGVTLLDLATGVDVGYLSLGFNWGVAFDPMAGDLLTYGEKGLFRWPVHTTNSTNLTNQDESSLLAGGERLRLGPPRRLPVGAGGKDQA